VPIAFASSTINCRRASKREVAPEKVKPSNSPSSPDTAPSVASSPAEACSGSAGLRRAGAGLRQRRQ
jgi:hypothetical protein